MGLETVILAIIIGTLFAIVYSLRVLVLMERRIARIDVHIEALIHRVLTEEQRIENEEKDIERVLGTRKRSKKTAAKKKATKKRSKKTKRK